jgi:hypothetical protein
LAPGDLGAAEGSRREPLRILARSLIGEDDSLHRGDGPRLRLAVRLERRAGDDDVGDPPTLVGIEADRVGTRIRTTVRATSTPFVEDSSSCRSRPP